MRLHVLAASDVPSGNTVNACALLGVGLGSRLPLPEYVRSMPITATARDVATVFRNVRHQYINNATTE